MLHRETGDPEIVSRNWGSRSLELKEQPSIDLGRFTVGIDDANARRTKEGIYRGSVVLVPRPTEKAGLNLS